VVFVFFSVLLRPESFVLSPALANHELPITSHGLCPSHQLQITSHGLKVRSHKDLDVWKAAIRLAKAVYDLTGTFPRREVFGLAAQMRRSSVSIASNIAEGAARQGNKEFVQFLYVSLGSASELDTQIEIARLAELARAESLEKIGFGFDGSFEDAPGSDPIRESQIETRHPTLTRFRAGLPATNVSANH